MVALRGGAAGTEAAEALSGPELGGSRAPVLAGRGRGLPNLTQLGQASFPCLLFMSRALPSCFACDHIYDAATSHAFSPQPPTFSYIFFVHLGRYCLCHLSLPTPSSISFPLSSYSVSHLTPLSLTLLTPSSMLSPNSSLLLPDTSHALISHLLQCYQE